MTYIFFQLFKQVYKGEKNADNSLSKIVVTGYGDTFSFDKIFFLNFLVAVSGVNFSCLSES